MPFPPKPSAKQWAGGPPKAPPVDGAPPGVQSPPTSPGAPPPGADPNAPPSEDPDAQQSPKVDLGKAAPPPMAKVPGEDPQMIARAHQAIGRLIMEGGLPKDVIDALSKANSRLVETQHGPADSSDASPGKTPPPFPPKGKDGTSPAGKAAAPPPPPPAAGKAAPPSPPVKKPSPFPPR